MSNHAEKSEMQKANEEFVKTYDDSKYPNHP